MLGKASGWIPTVRPWVEKKNGRPCDLRDYVHILVVLCS
jgi:hypothetical protein